MCERNIVLCNLRKGVVGRKMKSRVYFQNNQNLYVCEKRQRNLVSKCIKTPNLYLGIN